MPLREPEPPPRQIGMDHEDWLKLVHTAMEEKEPTLMEKALIYAYHAWITGSAAQAQRHAEQLEQAERRAAQVEGRVRLRVFSELLNARADNKWRGPTCTCPVCVALDTWEDSGEDD